MFNEKFLEDIFMKGKNRIACLMLCFIMVLTSFVFTPDILTASAKTKAELEAEIAGYDKEIDTAKDKLAELKKKKEKQQEYLEALENQITVMKAKANALQSQINAIDEEIDELNILEADLLAMRRAIDGLHTPDGTPYKADFALIDGNIDRDFQLPARAVVKGDSLSMSIAAASILAKVTRDRMCEDMDKAYPQYGIAKHKGYGTKEHMAALREHGPSPIHRKQFIRFLNKTDDANK